MGVAAFGFFLALVILGLPVAFALLAASLFGIQLGGRVPLGVVPQRMFVSLDSFTLLAVPLFILAGSVMEAGGISQRIIRLSVAAVGHVRGGLAQVVTVAMIFFSDISGSSTADVAAIGGVMIPAMKRKGYSAAYSSAIVAAAGAMGILIPPCITMIIYGAIANVSVSAMFVAGFAPGFLMASAIMLVTRHIAHRDQLPLERERFSGRELLSATKGAGWALVMPVIIVGGIIGGFFTATEAAAVAAVYGLVVSLFVYRELKVRDLPRILRTTAITTGAVGLLVAGAGAFSWFLASERVTHSIIDLISDAALGQWAFLLVTNVLLLVVGTFLEALSATVIMTPLLLPVAIALGIDPVHFGIVMVANLGLGSITPPVAVSMYVASSIAKVPATKVIRPLLPYYIALLVALLVITYVPDVALFLPRLLLDYGS